MRYHEITAPRETLAERGQRGFPGFGQGLFRQAYYQFIVNALDHTDDQHVKEWLTNWFAEIFARDNPSFKAGLFKKAVADGKHYNSATPSFQQRHFYYLAQMVKDITDPHVHDFVRDWLGDVVGRTNSNFQPDRWAKFCDSGQ